MVHILSCGTPRRHRVVVTYPCSSPKYGPEVRQAINDALFTRLYIDQDVTRVDWTTKRQRSTQRRNKQVMALARSQRVPKQNETPKRLVCRP
ncbi:hypothetical protein GCM10009811_29650 [Nostocoides veronense]|uniref:Transposase n=1 Tax=Nostocoides veronense TaxID=330836 RepID=A0ABN2M0X1_9MICO